MWLRYKRHGLLWHLLLNALLIDDCARIQRGHLLMLIVHVHVHLFGTHRRVAVRISPIVERAQLVVDRHGVCRIWSTWRKLRNRQCWRLLILCIVSVHSGREHTSVGRGWPAERVRLRFDEIC